MAAYAIVKKGGIGGSGYRSGGEIGAGRREIHLEASFMPFQYGVANADNASEVRLPRGLAEAFLS